MHSLIGAITGDVGDLAATELPPFCGVSGGAIEEVMDRPDGEAVTPGSGPIPARGPFALAGVVGVLLKLREDPEAVGAGVCLPCGAGLCIRG